MITEISHKNSVFGYIIRYSKKPIFVSSLEESVDLINKTVKNGEILLLMGAGDIGSFVRDLPDLLKS